MAPEHKSRRAGNWGIPSRSRKVPPVSEKVGHNSAQRVRCCGFTSLGVLERIPKDKGGTAVTVTSSLNHFPLTPSQGGLYFIKPR